MSRMTNIRNQEELNLILNLTEGVLEVPIVSISKIFRKLQDLINAIGMIGFSSYRLTKDLREKMQLSFSTISTGSLKLKLTSSEVTQLDIHGYSYCGKALDILFKLFNAGIMMKNSENS